MPNTNTKIDTGSTDGLYLRTTGVVNRKRNGVLSHFLKFWHMLSGPCSRHFGSTFDVKFESFISYINRYLGST